MIDEDKLAKLRELRAELSAKRFLVRCCFSLMAVGIFNVVLQRTNSWKAIILYIVGIPLFLMLYDRIIALKQ